MEFLLVRWYNHVDSQAGWDSRLLDTLRFPAITNSRAFGFVDPADVLRSCHLIPKLARGKVKHLHHNEVSKLAQDSQDWHFYYANRYVRFYTIFTLRFIHWLLSDSLTAIWLCDITGAAALGTRMHVPA